jgi:hypothetical protein
MRFESALVRRRPSGSPGFAVRDGAAAFREIDARGPLEFNAMKRSGMDTTEPGALNNDFNDSELRSQSPIYQYGVDEGGCFAMASPLRGFGIAGSEMAFQVTMEAFPMLHML